MNNDKKKPKVEPSKLLAKFLVSTPADEKSRKSIPNLFELLCPKWHDNICTRQPGRLTISADGGAWRVSLECPTEGVKTSLLFECLQDCLTAFEAVLSGGEAHWGLTYAKARKNLPTIDD